MTVLIGKLLPYSDDNVVLRQFVLSGWETKFGDQFFVTFAQAILISTTRTRQHNGVKKSQTNRSQFISHYGNASRPLRILLRAAVRPRLHRPSQSSMSEREPPIVDFARVVLKPFHQNL